MKIYRQVVTGIMVIAWMIVIYVFSDQPNSNEVTENVFGSFNYFVRKGAHMTEFGILFCLLLSFILSCKLPQSQREVCIGRLIPDKRVSRQQLIGLSKQRTVVYLSPFAIASLIAIFYAMTDEWHQSFVPGRSAIFSDVLIDTLGIVIAAVLMAILLPFCDRFDR